MKRYFLVFLLLAASFSFLSKPVFAQEVELEECQKYYQFGEVKVNLNTKKTSYSQGEKIELFGTIVNKNSFPLLNITIYAHLKRINEDTYLENGHFLVDRLTLAQDLNFLPKETKELKATFDVKENYSQAKYQLQYFVFSKDGFCYSGRPFLEEDFAGVTNFEIVNTITPEVYFDLNSLTLNGNLQKVRQYIPIFNPGENPIIEVSLRDSRSQKSDLQGVFKWYAWDDSFEENLIKTEEFHISSNQAPVFQTVFNLPEPGAYVLLLEINNPVRSLFKFRIARRGEKADRLRMNDLGITNYLVDPQKDRAFVCFHSPSEENSPQTRVNLSLFDKNGQVLEQKTIENSFGGEVMAISLPLTKLADPLNFSIQADFQNLENPSLSQKVRREFSPDLFDKSLVDLDVTYDPSAVGGPKLNLSAINLVDEVIADAPLERLVIYQDGQIKDEQYNLDSIPAEYDLSKLSPGNYKLLVKSGSIEKEMEFEVGGFQEEKVKKRNWWLIILGVVFLTGLISLIVFFRRKRKLKLLLENESRKKS